MLCIDRASRYGLCPQQVNGPSLIQWDRLTKASLYDRPAATSHPDKGIRQLRHAVRVYGCTLAGGAPAVRASREWASDVDRMTVGPVGAHWVHSSWTPLTTPRPVRLRARSRISSVMTTPDGTRFLSLAQVGKELNIGRAQTHARCATESPDPSARDAATKVNARRPPLLPARASVECPVQVLEQPVRGRLRSRSCLLAGLISTADRKRAPCRDERGQDAASFA